MQVNNNKFEDFRLPLRNGNCINLEKYDFDGDIPSAMAYLREFCADPQNTVTPKNGLRGYGTLNINGIDHRYTPGGISLKTMLVWCDKNVTILKKEKLENVKNAIAVSDANGQKQKAKKGCSAINLLIVAVLVGLITLKVS